MTTEQRINATYFIMSYSPYSVFIWAIYRRSDTFLGEKISTRNCTLVSPLFFDHRAAIVFSANSIVLRFVSIHCFGAASHKSALTCARAATISTSIVKMSKNIKYVLLPWIICLSSWKFWSRFQTRLHRNVSFVLKKSINAIFSSKFA